jgi:adenosylmethionine-8-amino-7-oxononanoate aminotransferase
VWHPYTPLVDAEEPLACIGAQDEFLHLADGRKIIDGISSWWTILHGHRHPPLMQALVEATGRLDHVMFAGVTHPDAIELADLLLGTMPWVGGRVFYSDNGSTAVEVALKMAYQFWCHHGEPQRTRFVGFEHGYHGDTFGAMAVGRDPLFFGRFEPLLFGADILPLDPARLEEHLNQHAEQIAAVILEPLVQGAGGMRMHAPETLRQVVEITQRHGVLFIADEVMTGGGRTGTLWAHQAAAVIPDLLCAGKTLTGGVLPLSATLAAPKIVEAFMTADRTRTFFHGHSFTANPLACAVAVRNYRTLLANPLAAPRRIEQFWTQSLAPLKAHPRVKELGIRGSITAVEVDADGGYLAEAGRTMRRVCLEQGVLLRPLGSVIYAMPPYGASDDSLGRIAGAMIAAVNAL